MLAKRYLLKELDGTVLENPEEMFERVARRLADVERDYHATGTGRTRVAFNVWWANGLGVTSVRCIVCDGVNGGLTFLLANRYLQRNKWSSAGGTFTK